ncbi:MAG: permease [Nitrospirae bacterium]|nr:permease [Nitrospirota bacterium]
MMIATVLLIGWHVWLYGPTNQFLKPGSSQQPFLISFANEIFDMIFSGHGLLAELKDIFPYFMIGIFLAGFIRTYKLTVRLRRYLNTYGVSSVFLASLLGILTPLCACGTLTTAVSLLFAGLPLAPVMALLVTSPLMSPSAYLLTLNDLGPQWTVIRTMAAFSMGIFAGVITHLVRNKGFQPDAIMIEGAVPRGDFHDENYPDSRLKCNCKEKFGNRVAAKTGNMFVIFLAKSSEMLWLVGKYVLAGVAIGTVAERYMPYEWLYKLFGQDDKLNILWITFGSVPIFLHQISASSIVYHIKSTLNGTLNSGAALAFMIGGPVTAIPTMVMFWTIFKRRVFFLYMFVCIAGTLLISYSFQYLVFVPHADMDNPLFRGVGSISGGSSSIINKVDKNVRIVMDPGGKNIIASYSNDLEGKGNVVFDSGFERFLNAAAGKYDNRRYIENIAQWLEENNSSVNDKKILIYNTFNKSGLDKNAFINNATSALTKENGFKVNITDRKERPAITEEFLKEYSQLWIFFGEASPEDCFSDDELNIIFRFAEEGRGMLIVTGGDQVEAGKDRNAANRIAGRFGVTFSGFVENKKELRVSSASYFFDKMSGILGRILKLVHKA